MEAERIGSFTNKNDASSETPFSYPSNFDVILDNNLSKSCYLTIDKTLIL